MFRKIFCPSSGTLDCVLQLAVYCNQVVAGRWPGTRRQCEVFGMKDVTRLEQIFHTEQDVARFEQRPSYRHRTLLDSSNVLHTEQDVARLEQHPSYRTGRCSTRATSFIPNT